MDNRTEHSPFEVRISEEFGRYLVASRDVETRSLIIHEGPVVCGPADDDQDMNLGEVPICLGCFSRMVHNPWSRCTKCGWPVCGTHCEKMKIHSEYECDLFTSSKVQYPPRHTWPIINKSILVLRCLLVKTKCPADWEEVIYKLEHHTDRRQMKPYCVKGDEMLLDNLIAYLGDQGYELENDIIRVSGVININAFSTTQSRGPSSSEIMIAQCIFRNGSLLAHSCVPNATWRINDKFEISVRSTVEIKKGEMITIAYSSQDNLYGTLHRQISNEDVAHFICNCTRCKDSTELGTYISGIKCFSCKNDYLLPENPLEPDSRWRCQGCCDRQMVEKIVLLVYEIGQKYERILRKGYSRVDEVLELESLMKSTKDEIFHENHYILQEIRMRIIKRQIVALDCLDEEDLDRFIQHSKLLLNIANVLAPGFSQLRALLQYFWAQGLLRKVQRERFSAKNETEIENVYKWIYALESRALLFFKSHNNPQCDQLSASIQKQLDDLSKCITM